MKGLSVEPGERTACGHVDLAGAALVEIVGGRDAGQHLAGRVDRPRGSRPRCRRRARGRARARGLRGSSAASRRWSVDARCAPARPRPPASAACGASIGIGLRAVRHRLGLARATSSGGMTPAAATRSSTRSRALRARVRRSGRAGAAPATAAARPAARPRRASAGAAPCRNRRATPRARLRDCRHRARGSR